jgi:superfamily I DNA/RNA helicase
VLEANTEEGEAVVVGRMIEKLIGGTGFHSFDFNKLNEEKHAGPYGFSDFVILYRTGDQGRIFAKAFDRAGIPYQIVSKETIFSQKAAQYIISLLRLTEGCGSYLDLERTINLSNSGIGKKTLEQLKSWAFKNHFSVYEAAVRAKQFPINGMRRGSQLKLNQIFAKIFVLTNEMKNMAVDQKINYIVERNDLPRNTNLIFDDRFKRIVSYAENFAGDTSGFLSTLSLQTDTDIYDSRAERVSLMTMHASKGLEFPVVFITGCEERLIPFQKTKEAPTNIHEERRLFYVAMTRARENLYLTYAKKRKIHGRQAISAVSPFLEQIEKSLRQRETSAYSKKKKATQRQLKLF